MAAPPPDVAEYLAACPAQQRKALLALRSTILAATPDASERLSYRIPTVFSAGRSVVSYAAFTAHCSLFGGYLAAELARAHGGVTVKASTVHFTPDKPLPKALVVRIVKGRLAENAKAVARRTNAKAASAPARRAPAKRAAKPTARRASKTGTT